MIIRLLAITLMFVSLAEAFPNSAIVQDATLATDFPGEKEALDIAITNRDYTALRNAAVDLLDKAKARCKIAGDARSGASFRSAWRTALSIRSESSDAGVRTAIEQEWQNGLADDTVVQWQLYALSDRWDPSLMVLGFWRVLDTTTNPKVLTAACLALCAHGSRQDLDTLNVRIKRETDQNLLKILIGTRDWAMYLRDGRARGQAAPATTCPFEGVGA